MADAAVARAQAAVTATLERIDGEVQETEENNDDDASLTSLSQGHLIDRTLIEAALTKARKCAKKAKQRAALTASKLQTGVNTKRNE